MGVSFCVTVNGEWPHFSQAPHLYGCFLGEALECHILPYFKVGDKGVDIYDGQVFEGEELDKLVSQLKKAVDEFKSKGVDWPLGGQALEAHYNHMKVSLVTILPPRDESIAEFERAIELAKLARNTNEKLQFLGD